MCCRCNHIWCAVAGGDLRRRHREQCPEYSHLLGFAVSSTLLAYEVRTAMTNSQVFGRFELQPAARRLMVDGEPTHIGRRAFDVLLALVERRDRVVSKDELLVLAWPGLVVEENNLQVQISALRKVLGADAISTVAGHGYRFMLEPTEGSARPRSPQNVEKGWRWWVADAPGNRPLPAFSVVVLPFTAADSPVETQFADALTTDLMTAFDPWRWLTLSSHRPPSTDKRTAIDVRAVGRKHGARYAIDGAVRLTRDGIVVSTQLMDAETGIILSSDRLESFTTAHPATGAREPANHLAKRLSHAIYEAELRRVERHLETGSAWDLVLLGDVAVRTERNVLKGLDSARRRYDEALRINANFAPALWRIGAVLDLQMTNDFGASSSRREQRLEEMDNVTAHSIRVDSSDSDAWLFRAIALLWMGRVHEALAANENALALNSSSIATVANQASMLLAADRLDEALLLAEQASSMKVYFAWEEGFAPRMVGYCNLMLGRYNEAVRACEKAAASRDNWWMDQAWLAAGLAMQGDLARAASAKATLIKLQPEFTIERFKAVDALTRSALYLQRAETHLYCGLRKLGIAD